MADWQDLFVTAADGLKLHVRAFGSAEATGLPVVCLPGLSRSSADFEELAIALATSAVRPRQVFALDYRGRGQSDYDKNPANYALSVEVADLITVLSSLNIARAVFVGTSRGGILTMLLATLRPEAIAGVVLNDIGPVIEPAGLMRIKGYVGKLPTPSSFEDGAEILRRLGEAQFPKLKSEDWLRQAKRTWTEKSGEFVLLYDPALAATLQDFDPEKPVPDLWAQFDALAEKPLMIIRGANSDILSAKTIEAMRARRASYTEAIEVPDQGHAPLLVEPGIIKQIENFVGHCEKNATL
ncbi:MAG TPA: alpha/beta hydrolase [Xanthobacteraceae bacterium]|jgi:pimeloyl-ACP methyl ester carboxylesterase|nr:alpha/beta hydrolase [Xanthobacteraceae bacterium]